MSTEFGNVFLTAGTSIHQVRTVHPEVRSRHPAASPWSHHGQLRPHHRRRVQGHEGRHLRHGGERPQQIQLL